MIAPIEPSETALAKPGLAERLRALPGWQKGGLVLAPIALLAAGVSLANRDAPRWRRPLPPP